MYVGGNKRNSNDPLKNTQFYPLGSVTTSDPFPTCLNGAKSEIDGTGREFTALFPNAGKASLPHCIFRVTHQVVSKLSIEGRSGF